jgi:diacylglycerol O-acyltransferase
MRINRLSTADLAMLVPDEFGWPQDIAAIAIVEGAKLLDAKGAVRIELIRDAIARRLHLVPRFRQLVVEPPRGCGLPYWTDDGAFDIAHHVGVLPLPPGAGEPELLAAFETNRARGFDRSRPLWEMWLLPGLAAGNIGLVVKVHHTLADGVAGVAIFGALLDFAPSPTTSPTPTAPAWQPRRAPSRRALLFDNLRHRLAQLTRPLRALLHPLRTLRTLRRLGPMLRELTRDADAPLTSLARLVRDRRRALLIRSTLATFKRIAHAHGATVNDVLLAVVASGLRALLVHRGEPVDGLVLRAAVPISLHRAADPRADTGGNADSGMVVRIPIGETDEVQRLAAISIDTRLRKQQPRPQLTAIDIPGARAVLRGVYRRAGRQRMANIYVANVPGPPVPLYLAGAKLLELFPVVPLTGNLPLAAGALSYAGRLAITVVADPDACPDAGVFVAAVGRAIDTLAAASRTSGAHAA